MTRARAVAAAVLMTVLGGSVAWGYWSAPSTAGSAGASAAASVDAGQTPGADASGTSVTVTWSASTLSNGAAVSGYRIKRYDAGTLAPQTVLAGCAGTVAATSCVEAGVPEGRWVYTVTPLVGSSWTGAESGYSVPVWAEVTPPTNNISLAPVNGGSFMSGNTVFYRGTAAGSFRLTNVVGDAHSGPASSTTAALGGTTTGWSHTPSTVATPAGGPFTSDLFSWSPSTTSSPTESVTGRDVAGNTAVTGLTFGDDSTEPAPTATDVTGLAGTGNRYAPSLNLDVTFSKGADTGAGLAASGHILERAQAALASTAGADGVCGAYGAYGVVSGGADPVAPKAESVADGACYRYRYNVVDNVGNVRANTSADIKVDRTAPSTPTLGFSALTNAWWSGAGTIVYYRSAASSGSFTATASSADAQSGILTYEMPTLGSGWATGGTGAARTYSWSAASPSTPGTQAVTATNHASLVSGAGSFAPTADDTAPTGAAISYADGDTTSTTVALTLTNGSDGGSGIGAHTLQRASAPLVDNACGSFTGFSTIASNPTSSYNDSVSRDTCYRYQYVADDNVGNTTTATNAGTVKVQSYNTAVRSTAGLLSHWRLGETSTSYDAFTGSNGVNLTTRVDGPSSSAWTKSNATGADNLVIHSNRIRKNGTTTFARYWSAGVPAGADYSVEADVYVVTKLANDWIGVLGRLDTAVVNGTYYAAAYNEPTQAWTLYRVVDGTRSTLGTPFVQALANTSTHQLTLDMSGSTIRLLVNGVERVSATDTTITAAGRGGVQQGNGTASINVGTGNGMRLDNFRVTPPLTDGYGANIGAYLNGVTLGVAGAISGDASTAAQFNGVSTHARVTRQISDDFTIELWFKSTQGIGTSTSWTGGAGLVDADVTGTSNDFGVSLRSDGRVMAGTGSPDTSIVSGSGGYNNGAWHHVVLTRTRSSGALTLYVDGAVAGTATGGTTSLTGPATIDFGRIATGTNYFAGTLDEVAVYSTAISGATVSAHYAAR